MLQVRNGALVAAVPSHVHAAHAVHANYVLLPAPANDLPVFPATCTGADVPVLGRSVFPATCTGAVLPVLNASIPPSLCKSCNANVLSAGVAL